MVALLIPGLLLIMSVVIVFIILILIGVYPSPLDKLLGDKTRKKAWGDALIAGTVIGTVVGFGLMTGIIFTSVSTGGGPIVDLFCNIKKTGKILGNDEETIKPLESHSGANEHKEDCGCNSTEDKSNGSSFEDFNEMDYLESTKRKKKGAHEKDIAEKFENLLNLLEKGENSEKIKELQSEVSKIKTNVAKQFEDTINLIKTKSSTLISSTEKLDDEAKNKVRELFNDIKDMANESAGKSSEISTALEEIYAGLL